MIISIFILDACIKYRIENCKEKSILISAQTYLKKSTMHTVFSRRKRLPRRWDSTYLNAKKIMTLYLVFITFRKIS